MLRRHGLSRSRHRSRGQSLAEFAIVFPVLMLIVGGIIQFGIIFWGLNTLNQVVRDTGRWAATQQLVCDPADPVLVAAVIQTANDIARQSSLIGYIDGEFTAANTTVAWPAPAVPATPCPPRDNQDVRYVTISITHSVPIFFPFVPGNGQISSSTEFRMEPKPK